MVWLKYSLLKYVHFTFLSDLALLKASSASLVQVIWIPSKPTYVMSRSRQLKGQSQELRMCRPKLKTWKTLQHIPRLTRLKEDGGCKWLWGHGGKRKNSGRKKQFLTWNSTNYSGLRTDDVFSAKTKYISEVARSKIRASIWVFLWQRFRGTFVISWISEISFAFLYLMI